MNISIRFLVFLALGLGLASACQNCVAPGGACDSSNLCQYPIDYACVNSKCVMKAVLNETCSSNDDCAGVLNCPDGTCIYTGFAGRGEKCGSTLDCANDFECISGVCTYTGSGECDSTDSCYANQYCDRSSSKCYYLPTRGEACTDDCDAASTCDNGVCVAFYQKPINANCTSSYQCDFGQGLNCNITQGNQGSCVSASSLLPQGNCTTQSDDYCQSFSDSFCSCQTSKCEVTITYSEQCETSLTKFLTCAVQNNCSQVLPSPQSCYLQKCGLEYCESYNNCASSLDCFSMYSPYECSSILKAAAGSTDSSSISSASVLLINSLLLLLSAISLIIFIK